MNEIEKHIYEYIGELFPTSDMSYGSIEEYDYLTREYSQNDDKITFYSGGFADGEILFIYYTKDYWNGEELKEKMGETISIFQYKDMSKLEQFGNLWQPVFKKWFMDEFELPIKTFL